MRTLVAIVMALGATGGASTLSAQRIGPTASVGIAVPIGGYGTHRTAGPVVRGGLALGAPDHRVEWRLEGEGAWLLDRSGSPAVGGSSDGTLRSIGIFGSLVAGPRHLRDAPYVILAAGPEWIRVQGAVNPYGAVTGVRAGVGYRIRGQRMSWLAELAVHAVLSDFGTGQEYTAGTYVPITVGLQF